MSHARALQALACPDIHEPPHPHDTGTLKTLLNPKLPEIPGLGQGSQGCGEALGYRRDLHRRYVKKGAAASSPLLLLLGLAFSSLMLSLPRCPDTLGHVSRGCSESSAKNLRTSKNGFLGTSRTNWTAGEASTILPSRESFPCAHAENLASLPLQEPVWLSVAFSSCRMKYGWSWHGFTSQEIRRSALPFRPVHQPAI